MNVSECHTPRIAVGGTHQAFTWPGRAALRISRIGSWCRQPGTSASASIPNTAQVSPPRQHPGTSPVARTEGSDARSVTCHHVVGSGNSPWSSSARAALRSSVRYVTGPVNGKAPPSRGCRLRSCRSDMLRRRALQFVDRREDDVVALLQRVSSREPEVAPRAHGKEPKVAVHANELYDAGRGGLCGTYRSWRVCVGWLGGGVDRSA